MTRPTDLRAACPHASASFLRLNPQLNNSTTAKPSPVKSKTTTTDIAAHDPHDVTGGRHASKPRIRQDRGGMNRTESGFLEHLRNTRKAGIEIHREGLGFRLGNGCVYWPDFVTVDEMFSMTCVYEVKGFMRDDAAVKLKVAASKFPTFKFFLVTKRAKKLGGGWDIQEVLP